MKRKILSVLSVLMAVLMSTAALTACNKAPAGADSSGGSGESVGENQTNNVSFSCDCSTDKSINCSISLLDTITFYAHSDGGYFYKDGIKVAEVNIFAEDSGHNSWAESIYSHKQKAIGKYEYYVDSYETFLIEENESEDSQLEKYILYEYNLSIDSIWYSFRFFQRANSPIITQKEFECMLSTFTIE